MSGKTILFLHGSNDLYGASRVLLESIGVARKNGYAVVVVLSGAGVLSDRLLAEGVTVRFLNLGILRRKYFTPLGLINRLRKLSSANSVLRKIVRQENVSLIYSNTSAVLIGPLVARRMGIPHVWHIHEIISGAGVFNKLISSVMRISRGKVIAVSNAVSDHWNQQLPEPIVQVIYNGMDYSPFLSGGSCTKEELGFPAESLLVGMIGRVNLVKGQPFFLNIAEKLLSAGTKVKFVLAGDAYPGTEYLEEALNERISSSAMLKENVINLGYRTDVHRVMNALDVYVLPSVKPDSLPTTVLEAMAAAKPVVATRTGGASEMVLEGETGYMVEAGDTEAASNRITALLQSADLRAGFGRAGRDRVLKYFSKERYNMEMACVFKETIK
ncbi:MAG: glycosyltransferase family 4 protein [Bacteroidetes bacterium]|nr:glycosyltransferase family 4 protein [Bacteroidota bacterium]